MAWRWTVNLCRPTVLPGLSPVDGLSTATIDCLPFRLVFSCTLQEGTKEVKEGSQPIGLVGFFKKVKDKRSKTAGMAETGMTTETAVTGMTTETTVTAETGISPADDGSLPPGKNDICDCEAMLRLGERFEYGLDVAQDRSAAVGWYRRAAEAGHADAQHKLGVCYENEWGVAKDRTEAVKWYRRAAEQGHAKS